MMVILLVGDFYQHTPTSKGADMAKTLNKLSPLAIKSMMVNAKKNGNVIKGADGAAPTK